MSNCISVVDSLTPIADLHNEEEVRARAYFGRLEREYPQLIEAMKAMNISYQWLYSVVLPSPRRTL